MMNINDVNVDLGLTLGSSNSGAEKRLNNSSGAGVNANSRDIAFAASDPLSELVWSSHDGLSLKCADPSLPDKKPFLMWNVGPSTKCNSTSQSTRSKGSRDDDVVAEEKLTISQTMLDANGKLGDKAMLVRSSRSCPIPEIGASHGYCDESNCKMEEEAGTLGAIRKEENNKDNGEENLCNVQNVQIADIAESSKRNAEHDRTGDSKVDMVINGQFFSRLIRRTRRNQNSKTEINVSSSDILGLHSELRATKLSDALVHSLPNLQSREEADDEVTSATGEVNENKTRKPFSIPAPPLMMLESSAENELGHLTVKEARSLGETRLRRENSLPVDRTHSNSRICLNREKGKERALSDGDAYERASDDEDDSHESIESCNSVRLFSNGFKRPRYDQEPLVESKRMKKQIQGSYGSTSIIRPNSSFMNWMSNMVKGSDCNKEESCSLSLTLAHSNDVCRKNHQENFMCNNTHDSASLGMGFQTMFRSMYCRNTKMSDAGLQKENDPIEESEELMVADKKSLEIPGPCDRNNDNSCKQIIASNKEVNPRLSRNIVGHPSKPQKFFKETSCTPSACESGLAENKASGILLCNKAKNGVSPSDSLCKKGNSTAENTSLNIPLAMSNMPEKSNPIASLWITRFSTGNARLENCNEITQEANECSTECPKANLDNRITDVFPIDQKDSEARIDSSEHQAYAWEHEMQPVDFESTRVSPKLLSQKFRSSKAMASVIAKRLDAVRHIIQPSETSKLLTCTLTCLFCGGIGHDLHECPEVTETELEDLLVKITSSEGVEESPCLCIRCFQFDHWAVSCPLVSSSRRWRSEQNASVCAGNENCSSYLGGYEEKQFQIQKPFLGSLPGYLTWNIKESSRKTISNSNEFQKGPALNLENNLKGNKRFPPCNFVTAENIVAPAEMFHVISKLRLSRADILRWMNSNVSSSQLNGFFLRLRLRKLEAGIGGKCYYVACITGDTREHVGCRSKKSILVDVGGTKSSIGSQHVSNHDFLEDEIKAWWYRILKTGGKIPSLDELNSKFEGRKCLGF